jgi:hypothetical protein
MTAARSPRSAGCGAPPPRPVGTSAVAPRVQVLRHQIGNLQIIRPICSTTPGCRTPWMPLEQPSPATGLDPP